MTKQKSNKIRLHKMKDACVPCALHYVSEAEEAVVKRACTVYGWMEGVGMDDDDWRRAADLLGIKLREEKIEPMELRKVVKLYPKGLFFLGTYDHLFVLDHGRLFDPRCENFPGLRRTIKQLWRVIGGSRRELS